MEVPMLDEQEYAQAAELYRQGFRNIKEHGDRQVQFKSLLDYYLGLTGFHETEPNAILHHRIALYGPPREQCGRPLRTPSASFCAACGM
jgi:hypothetical protein